jgi:hypothetical protein
LTFLGDLGIRLHCGGRERLNALLTRRMGVAVSGLYCEPLGLGRRIRFPIMAVSPSTPPSSAAAPALPIAVRIRRCFRTARNVARYVRLDIHGVLVCCEFRGLLVHQSRSG